MIYDFCPDIYVQSPQVFMFHNRFFTNVNEDVTVPTELYK